MAKGDMLDTYPQTCHASRMKTGAQDPSSKLRSRSSLAMACRVAVRSRLSGAKAAIAQPVRALDAGRGGRQGC